MKPKCIHCKRESVVRINGKALCYWHSADEINNGTEHTIEPYFPLNYISLRTTIDVKNGD